MYFSLSPLVSTEAIGSILHLIKILKEGDNIREEDECGHQIFANDW